MSEYKMRYTIYEKGYPQPDIDICMEYDMAYFKTMAAAKKEADYMNEVVGEKRYYPATISDRLIECAINRRSAEYLFRDFI